MFKRLAVALTAFLVFFGSVVYVEAKTTFSKDDEWLIYMYICGTDLEENGHMVTSDITEIQQVKLPKNVKILIHANGSRVWHHPTIKEGGDGIYLYTSKRLEKLADRNENMGDPNTLANFLEYGEENFNPDHRILIFGDHGGLNGLCYDSAFNPEYRYNLTYDALTQVLSKVYPNFSEELPFELIGFDACLSASYELANSIAEFSHYMVGSEPSEYGWYYTDWIAALAKDPSINGAKIGKIICDSAMKSYSNDIQNIQTFSVVDLSKMPKLREANEEFFEKALQLSKESNGFSGAFARAPYSLDTDNYSDRYTDLWNFAKNTKDLMPEESKNLRKAIKKAVVYNNSGKFLNAKGISTAYPYIDSGEKLENFLTQNSMPEVQKKLYRNLMKLDVSNLYGVELSYNSDLHVVAELEPEQLENILNVECIMFTNSEGGGSSFGLRDDKDIVVLHSDDLKIDWKKGTITENIRPIQPVFDGHTIKMRSVYQGRGYIFYEVPIILQIGTKQPQHPEICNLQVRYDTTKKEYSILGVGNTIDNGMVLQTGYTLKDGDIITPIFDAVIYEDSPTLNDNTLFKYSYIKTEQYEDNEDIDSSTGKAKIKTREVVVNNALNRQLSPLDIFTNPKTGEPLKIVTDSETGKKIYIVQTAGQSFVYNKNSKITEKKISNGAYLGLFRFIAPNGTSSYSLPFVFGVEHGEMVRIPLDKDDLKDLAEENK